MNIDREVQRLKGMTTRQLREKYLEVFGEATRSHNKQFLVKRIAWRMQALKEGDLSERAHKRAMELARDADLRIRPGKEVTGPTSDASPQRTVVHAFSPSHDHRMPIVGTLLTREYRGEAIRVTVLEKGFEYTGEVYRSLTAIANAITGSHWNGYGFFGLLDKKGKK